MGRSNQQARVRLKIGMCTALIYSVLTACAPPSAAQPTTVQSLQPAPLSTPTPYVMPTPLPTALPLCPAAPKERLILQERGRVLPDDPRPINLRAAAGIDNRVVTQIPIRAVFYVLEGPRCEGEFAWYRVRYDQREGWIAEGDLTSYYVEPYLVG